MTGSVDAVLSCLWLTDVNYIIVYKSQFDCSIVNTWAVHTHVIQQ